MRRRVLAPLVLLALATLPLLGWSLVAGCGAGEPRARTVVLITIDTLRADRLSCYGHDRATSPRLDALAAGGVRFARALTPIPRTTQALASLMTGLEPLAHGVLELGGELDPARRTLAEALQSAGFSTAAAVVIPYLRPGGTLGLEQGFDDFELIQGEARAERVTDAGLAHARRLTEEAPGRRRFLWLHYRDPHAPYYPPSAYRDRFDPDYEGPLEEYFHYWPVDAHLRPLGGGVTDAMREGKKALKFGLSPLPPRDHQRALALYDAEIAYVDAEIGRFLDGLDELGLAEDALVVVTADHGESLGEHQFHFDHGEFLYDTCLHVPLIARGPGIEPRVVEAQVGLTGVAGSILDWLGIGAGFDGAEGFAWALDGGDGHGSLVVAESGEPLFADANPRFRGLNRQVGPRDRLRAVCYPHGVKVIVDPVGLGGVQVFDVRADPRELRDLSNDESFGTAIRVVKDLAAELHESGLRGRASEEDDEMRRRIAEAGYPR